VPNALFFHAKRVQPRWRLTRVGSVGNHVFYR
jgi:N-acetylmuramoyl-L-alanine amidase